jgi:trehalose utilization protein
MKTLLTCCVATLLGSLAVLHAAEPIRVLIWDEQQPEQKQAYGDKFLGETIAEYLEKQPGISVKTATLTDADQGLSDTRLDGADVLIFWCHRRVKEQDDARAEAIVQRVLAGKLSLIALHSAHWAKPFVRLMQERAKADAIQQLQAAERATAKWEFVNEKPYGKLVKADTRLTPFIEKVEGNTYRLTLPQCVFPAWRSDGKPSHVTTRLPQHPIAAGLPKTWDIPRTEMYGEPFHVPPPDQVVFEEKWDQGEQFRSGCVWQVGEGRVFYFRPGHETYPIYKQAETLRVLENAVRWLPTKAAPPEAEALWELSRDEIPLALQAGTITKHDGAIALRDGASFAVPAEAFPDQKNFTVQVTMSLSALVQDAVFTVMHKQTQEDNGFSFSFNYRDNPPHSRQVSSVVNKILMVGGSLNGRYEPKLDTPYTFTVAVREGLATFYIDDIPCKTCFMELIPNGEPMWIGRNANPKSKTMPATIHNVKVFGANYKYNSPKERKPEFPRGAVAGKGWALDVPKMEHADWPKVLIYGDSISNGYSGHFIPAMLKQNVYVFHCVHFVGGDVPEAALTEMAGRFKFDAVVFNNGLHSLHWTPDKVPDALVLERMQKLTRCFKQGAPQAKTFYLTTTPHTAVRPAPDQPVNALGDKNDIVLRLNSLSARVMKEEKIELIDAYALLAPRLELASGDNYHWQTQAYQLLGEEISNRVLTALKKDK